MPHEGDKWAVGLDVRALGGHPDTTFRGWSATLAATVGLVISRLVLISVHPLDFHGRLRVVRSLFTLDALYGIEVSLFAVSGLLRLRSAILLVVWSSRLPLTSAGAVPSMFGGRQGCDPTYWVLTCLVGCVPGCLGLSSLAWPVHALLGPAPVLGCLAMGKVFHRPLLLRALRMLMPGAYSVGISVKWVSSSLGTRLHVRERDIALGRSTCGGWGLECVYVEQGAWTVMFLVGFAVVLMDEVVFGEASTSSSRFVKIQGVTISCEWLYESLFHTLSIVAWLAAFAFWYKRFLSMAG